MNTADEALSPSRHGASLHEAAVEDARAASASEHIVPKYRGLGKSPIPVERRVFVVSVAIAVRV